MILDGKQARRFYKLFYALIVYANDCLQVSDHLLNRYGEPDDLEAFDVACELWNGSDNLYLIDTFADENPYGLSRSDLAEVRTWKSGVLDRFFLMRDGLDTVFLLGDHAIAVRGITQEIDAMMNTVPGSVETVLLPFDSLITYGVTVSEIPLAMGPGLLEILENNLREAKAAQRIIRGGREFIAKMPTIVEAVLAREAERFAHEAELDMNADEQGEQMHRGPLAGLTGEEREAAVRAHLDDNPLGKKILLEAALYSCLKGSPSTTLAQAYTTLRKRDLQEAARLVGVSGNISSMNKSELIANISSALPFDVEMLVSFLRQYGLWAIEGAKRLIEAGGHIELDDAEFEHYNQLPRCPFPVSLLYHVDSSFVCIMPEEIRVVLDGVDWDEELARAEVLERLFSFTNLLVDLRGVVFLDELIAELLERFGDTVRFDDVVDMLQFNSGIPEATFSLEMYDEVPVLANQDIVEDLESNEEVEAQIDYLLRRQRSKDARPVLQELEDAGYVEKWVLGFPEAQAFMAYLDEHVPDGADDWFFAEEFTGRLINGFQGESNPAKVLSRVMEDLKFAPTEAQLKRLISLSMDLASATPKWTNNGWAPNDLRTGKC